MATSEQIAPLPRVTLISGMTIAFEAIDPTTGNAVAGVVVSNVAVYADDSTGTDVTADTVEVTLPDSTPLWAPTPVAGL